MIRVSRSRWFRNLVFIAIALLILLFALQAWLLAGIGRGLVESRLSAALGRPVRLDGDFSIRVFPYPGASGTSMSVFTSDGRWLVLKTGSYFAQLSLWPLLEGEVEVLALALEKASIDLGRLSAEPKAEGGAVTPGIQLPAIGRLDLVDASLYFEGMGSQPYLLISRFSLDDFHLGAPSKFEAEIAVVDESGEQVTTASEGRLNLNSDTTIEVAISRLDIAFADWEVEGVNGKLEADLNRSVFDIELNWDGGDKPARIGASGAWDRLYDGGDAQAQDGLALVEVEVAFGDFRISGFGCAFGSEPLRLNLDLTSESLDLEALQAMIESWRQTAASPAPSAPGSSDMDPEIPGSTPDLPFDLALTMAVDQARFRDTVASGVMLRVGSVPQCREVR